ncbi:MAG: CheR family methyltransferase [Paracoccaceae bacterium]|jgi:chemotaxis protein methyltransferase CheR|nr:CheR family methyltransferase [Paracoccaceae bacterium]
MAATHGVPIRPTAPHLGARPPAGPAGPPLPRDAAEAISALVERGAGLHLDPAKTEFIAFRVGRRLRELGLSDFRAYLARLEADTSGAELRHLVESLTTHTTSFFREAHQYAWLDETGLDLLAETTRGPLRVWSAAASIGAELWSTAILLAERAARGQGPTRWELLGTDVSARVIARAERAVYTEEEIAGLSPGRRARYLMRARRFTDAGGRPLWRVVPELRAQARFARANLQELGELPDFAADVVFLRNVLIYFAPAAQARVVEGVARRLRPGGILFTGHAEAIGPHPALAPLRPSIYRKV